MSKHKLWFQKATDHQFMAPYIAKVEAHLKSVLDAEFSATFHTTTPPATTTHAVTEYRIGRNLIKNAVEAEKQGYAAMVITHFQDAGLAEVKSVVDIPVVGLGETTLMHSLTLGRKLGLVTINPVFIPWHEDQVTRYGLQCLKNLDQLPPTGAVVVAAPLKIRNGSGSPLRVLALVESK